VRMKSRQLNVDMKTGNFDVCFSDCSCQSPRTFETISTQQSNLQHNTHPTLHLLTNLRLSSRLEPQYFLTSIMTRPRGRRGRSGAPSPPPSLISVSSPSPSGGTRESPDAFCERLGQRLPRLRRTYDRAARIIFEKEKETNAAVAQALRAGSSQSENIAVQQQRMIRVPKASIENVQNVQVFILTSLEKARKMGMCEESFNEYGEREIFGTDLVVILELVELRDIIDETFQSISNLRNNIETLNHLTRVATEKKRKSSSPNSNVPVKPAAESTGSGNREECTTQQARIED
jgi:hypothetical protein